MALVIKKWKVSETAGQNGEFVHIHGREAGLLSFILSLLGVDPTTTFIVDAKSIRHEQGSLAGFERTVTPISAVAAAGFGYIKPWKKALIIAIIIGVILVFIPVIGQLIAAVIGLAYYFLNKELYVRYLNSGTGRGELKFKRSIIEGQSIDEQAGERIVAIIEMLVLGQEKPRILDVAAGCPTSVKAALDRAGEELSVVAERTRKRADDFAAQARDMGERAAAKIAPLVATSGSASVEVYSGPAKCSNCGATVNLENTFCAECGGKLR